MTLISLRLWSSTLVSTKRACNRWRYELTMQILQRNWSSLLAVIDMGIPIIALILSRFMVMSALLNICPNTMPLEMLKTYFIWFRLKQVARHLMAKCQVLQIVWTCIKEGRIINNDLGSVGTNFLFTTMICWKLTTKILGPKTISVTTTTKTPHSRTKIILS